MDSDAISIFPKLIIFDMTDSKIKNTVVKLVANHWRSNGCRLKLKDIQWFLCDVWNYIENKTLNILFYFNEFNEFSEKFDFESRKFQGLKTVFGDQHLFTIVSPAIIKQVKIMI